MKQPTARERNRSRGGGATRADGMLMDSCRTVQAFEEAGLAT